MRTVRNGSIANANDHKLPFLPTNVSVSFAPQSKSFAGLWSEPNSGRQRQLRILAPEFQAARSLDMSGPARYPSPKSSDFRRGVNGLENGTI